MYTGDSAADKSEQLQNNLYASLSKPLKNVQVAMLTEVTSTCYKARWMEESFTNWEQINLCKAEAYNKFFGKFNDALQKHRDSTKFKFQDCDVQAGNNVEKAVVCVRSYLKGMEQDNEKLLAFAK